MIPKDEKKIYVFILEFMLKCFFMFYLINKMHLSKNNILNLFFKYPKIKISYWSIRDA